MRQSWPRSMCFLPPKKSFHPASRPPRLRARARRFSPPRQVAHQPVGHPCPNDAGDGHTRADTDVPNDALEVTDAPAGCLSLVGQETGSF
jgi:hypothetical protein